MFRKVTTLTEFILNEERRLKNTSGSFTLLLTQIENAAKIIASHIKKTGLVDILGYTGEKNIYQEEVMKLDEYCNDLYVDVLKDSGQVRMIASEELDEPIILKKNVGNYDVFIDPLDGSSNIDTNISVGTIFSIYRKNSNVLQPGKKQVAAGYILYSSSVMFVYSSGNGVNGFTLDPSVGSFLLSHQDIKMPKKGNIYSINEGNYYLMDQSVQNYLNYIKKIEKPYKLRYIGAMVADVHRTLLKGGIFIYPQDKKNPDGKLRLMFEVNPFSYIVNQAGGSAYSNTENPLNFEPKIINQRVPIVLGSKENVNEYLNFIEKSL